MKEPTTAVLRQHVPSQDAGERGKASRGDGAMIPASHHAPLALDLTVKKQVQSRESREPN